MDLLLKGDFLLVKEIVLESKIEGTNLNIKYDDTNHYLTAEIVAVSEDLPFELSKYYPVLQNESISALRTMIDSKYKPGTKVILQRIAKVPYKDGLYFISFKDILAIIQDGNINSNIVEDTKIFKQMNLFESE